MLRSRRTCTKHEVARRNAVTERTAADEREAAERAADEARRMEQETGNQLDRIRQIALEMSKEGSPGSTRIRVQPPYFPDTPGWPWPKIEAWKVADIETSSWAAGNGDYGDQGSSTSNIALFLTSTGEFAVKNSLNRLRPTGEEYFRQLLIDNLVVDERVELNRIISLLESIRTHR